MIIYRHKQDTEHPDLKGWVHREGSDAAVCHQADEGWRYCGICDPVYWQIPTAATWRPIDNDWEVAQVDAGPWLPGRDLARLTCWARVLTVMDAKDQHWQVPVILSHAGIRAYPVAYMGADFLPTPTPEQARADQIAAESRRALTDGLVTGLPIAPACRWAAILLSITHHLSPAVIAELGFLDSALVSRVLAAACGMDERLEEAHG